jgi:hypothetical protein
MRKTLALLSLQRKTGDEVEESQELRLRKARCAEVKESQVLRLWKAECCW